MSVHTAAGKICNSHTNTPSLKQMPSCSTTKYLQVCKFSLSCTLENPLITMQRQCTFCTGQLRNGECCSLALNSIQSSGAGEAHATKLVPAIPHRLISYEMRQIWNHSSCDWVTICFASLEQLSEGSYIYIYIFFFIPECDICLATWKVCRYMRTSRYYQDPSLRGVHI